MRKARLPTTMLARTAKGFIEPPLVVGGAGTFESRLGVR
jgi:hypothetical protein